MTARELIEQMHDLETADTNDAAKRGMSQHYSGC